MGSVDVVPEETVPKLATLAAVKSLANPRRRQILQRLRVHGPATSAILARDLDLNTGATSYHLRELASCGFVEEAPERAHGRQRWWRAVAQDLRFPPRSEQSPEMRQALEEMNRLGFAADLDGYARAYAASSATAGGWADAFPFSRGTIDVTREELDEFVEEYIALLKRYQRPADQRPDGAQVVFTTFFARPALPD